MAPLIDFGAMGPLGRAGLFLALVGALVSIVGALVWQSAASGLEREAWFFQRSRERTLPKTWHDAYRTLDTARAFQWCGTLTALTGLALALLNANRDRRPRTPWVPLIVSAASLLLSLLTFALCSLPIP